MKLLPTGQFFGTTNETIQLSGLTMTDTVYTHDKVDWHYHENAYFTFILQGNVIEGNKKEVYNCPAGSLLFHHWQEPHYNIKSKGFTRGFHIELNEQWIKSLQLDLSKLQGNMFLSNPDLKLAMYNIFKESKIQDGLMGLSLESMLLQLLTNMKEFQNIEARDKPKWVSSIQEILHDEYTENPTLSALAHTIGIHPVHLSRDFQKYFKCGLGEYVRKLKVEKALNLLANKKSDISTIAYDCGFADQSHLNRCFKAITGYSPLKYRNLLFY